MPPARCAAVRACRTVSGSSAQTRSSARRKATAISASNQRAATASSSSAVASSRRREPSSGVSVGRSQLSSLRGSTVSAATAAAPPHTEASQSSTRCHGGGGGGLGAGRASSRSNRSAYRCQRVPATGSDQVSTRRPSTSTRWVRRSRTDGSSGSPGSRWHVPRTPRRAHPQAPRGQWRQWVLCRTRYREPPWGPASGPARSSKQEKEAHVAHKLVIVESPAKARTIGGYLGAGYVVESSIGHIRDLPNNAADTPAKIKDKPWGRLAVDVENGFEPYYVVPRDKKSHITKLKGLLKDADELYLATDEDREGEAIAWHLLDELKPKGIPVHRMVFHEITKPAIQAAVENPRQINDDLVEAQEARRILDRPYGYEVSPVLWRKVMSGLSAGRVQSVATRLVVDRERERMRFRVASYWDLEGTFDAGSKHEQRMFPAKLHSVDGARVARGSDFGPDGLLKDAAKVVHLDRSRAEALAAALEDTTYDVRSVESKPYRRSPYAPFRTTTLQQEASRKMGFSASSTMSVAQRLYENGFITYMRTDSTTLSETAVGAARSQVRELYGAEYLPDSPRAYTSKVKNAQEAHEAIRPAGESFRTPAQTGLSGEQFRLYELIWMRTVASQMKDAVGNSVTIRLGGAASDGRDVVFSASGRTITFHGFLKAYVEDIDDASKRKDDAETRLPNLTEGAAVSAATLSPEGHETKPPARYTEATLIKELEDREIGRPSTYASIIGTILNRGYVYKK